MNRHTDMKIRKSSKWEGSSTWQLFFEELPNNRKELLDYLNLNDGIAHYLQRCFAAQKTFYLHLNYFSLGHCAFKIFVFAYNKWSVFCKGFTKVSAINPFEVSFSIPNSSIRCSHLLLMLILLATFSYFSFCNFGVRWGWCCNALQITSSGYEGGESTHQMWYLFVLLDPPRKFPWLLVWIARNIVTSRYRW